MKVLHINTSDTSGGAAIAAMRLHKAMLKAGIDSTFFCLKREINDDEKIITVNRVFKIRSQTLDVVHRLCFNKIYLSSQKGLFSNMNIGYKIGRIVNLSEYDIIYIHWVNNGFLSISGVEEICKTGKKVFWFLHDMFPITGGCHHSFSCNGYKTECRNGKCLYMRNQKTRFSFASKQMKKKHKAFDKYQNLSFIASSNWLYECAKVSSIAKGHNVFHIPLLLNDEVFHPLEKKYCREVLNLPKDKRLILFGADSALNNPYKGFDYLVKALKQLNTKEDYKDVQLMIFGASRNLEIEKKLPYSCYFFGYLHDEVSLSLLYNAADVFCMPSLAEAFGQTALESIFCGTPVVAFDVGGLPDFVSGETGYLARLKDSEDFSRGIEICLTREEIHKDNVVGMCNSNYIIDKHLALWK